MKACLKERLRSLREEAGISQEKLASELNVTRMTIAGYELGKRPPDSEIIYKVCDLFDCTPDYLMGFSPFKNNTHYEERKKKADSLDKVLNSIPEKHKDRLFNALEVLFQSKQGYRSEKLINIIHLYADIINGFYETFDKADGERGLENDIIFEYYKYLNSKKKDIYDSTEQLSDSLTDFLIHNSEVLLEATGKKKNK